MTKKELKQEVRELREKLGEIRYKAKKYDEVTDKLLSIEKALRKQDIELSRERAYLVERIRELTLRNDILTMTPDQIESMRKIKVKGNLHDPLDLEAPYRR